MAPMHCPGRAQIVMFICMGLFKWVYPNESIQMSLLEIGLSKLVYLN